MNYLHVWYIHVNIIYTSNETSNFIPQWNIIVMELKTKAELNGAGSLIFPDIDVINKQPQVSSVSDFTKMLFHIY